MRHIGACFVEFADLALRKNFLAEVALVNRTLKDDFIDALQFGEREFLRQQFVANCRPL